VVDKPAGLVVHPGSGQAGGTLVSGLLSRYPEMAALALPGAEERPGIVHRLDKGTSGLMVVARSGAGRSSLQEQVGARTMEREYLALVEGLVEPDGGLVDAPLGRSASDPTRIAVVPGGREARTRYEVVDRFDRPRPATLVRCRLETGRTHQIRVHMASIGHPVADDDRYGRRGSRRGGGRPFLHAARLGFHHPTTGGRLSFASDLPPDLADLLAAIGQAGRPLL
jgi:23S rRNA pseudouridine1911/1915/1917 synthase